MRFIFILFVFSLVYQAHAQPAPSASLSKFMRTLDNEKIDYEFIQKCSKELRACNDFHLGNHGGGGSTRLHTYVDTNSSAQTLFGLLHDLRLPVNLVNLMNSQKKMVEISYFEGRAFQLNWAEDFVFLSVRDIQTKQAVYIRL